MWNEDATCVIFAHYMAIQVWLLCMFLIACSIAMGLLEADIDIYSVEYRLYSIYDLIYLVRWQCGGESH